MANPRKFSEKIALHNQKQAEETAAFEQIMREVSDATSKVFLFVNKIFFSKFFFLFEIVRSTNRAVMMMKSPLIIETKNEKEKPPIWPAAAVVISNKST